MNEQANNAGDAGDDVTRPLGLGDFGEQELVLTDVPRRKIPSGALLIVAVAAIAAVGLFSMRTLTRASAAGAAPKEIEQSIEQFLDVVMKKSETQAGKEGVLQVLNEAYSTRQVPLAEVQRNPFIIFEAGAPETPVVAGPGDSIGPRRRARIAQFEAAGSRLRLSMVLMGEQPLANVNNRVVRVGETVPVDDVTFRVESITADRVDLVADDAELGVRLEKSLVLRRD